MLFVFLIGLILGMFSMANMFVKYLPKGSGLFAGIASLWIIVTFCSIIFSTLTFLQIDFYVFIALFVLGVVALTLFSAKDLVKHFGSVKTFFRKDNFIFAILIFTGIIVFSFLFTQQSTRWGTWDAWTIWNLHAKFMASDGAFFGMFLEPSFTAKDYPLLLPSINAILWKLTNTTTPIIPIIVSFFISLSVPLLAVSALKIKNKVLTLVLLVLIVGNISFIIQGAWQYADTLLGLFLLFSVVLMYTSEETKNHLLLPAIIGFFAASCGWIKNEGILMFLIISIIYFIKNIKAYKHILAYIAGTVIPLALVFTYKLFITPPNDFLSQLNADDIFSRLFDFSRYTTVAEFLFLNVLVENHIPILILLAATLFFKAAKPSAAGFVIIAVSLSYFFVYIITNSDLLWNLQTSSQRLFQQLFPSLLFIIFVGLTKSEHPLLRKVAALKYFD